MQSPRRTDERRFGALMRGRAGFALYIVLWLLVYAALLSAYNYSYRFSSEILIHRLQVRPAAALLSWLNPDAEITHDTLSVSSKEVRIALMRGCDGVEAWLILLSALLVFPMPWRHRLGGIALGSIVIFGLNLTRIVTLFWVVSQKPEWFDTAHGMVWQSLMVLAASLFAWFWIQATPPPAPREGVPS